MCGEGTVHAGYRLLILSLVIKYYHICLVSEVGMFCLELLFNTRILFQHINGVQSNDWEIMGHLLVEWLVEVLLGNG